MQAAQILKSTQGQAVASWIDFLNQLRLDELVAKLAAQGANFEGAMNELQQLKDFVANPDGILGSLKSKHGETAEYFHVNISNARRIIEGLSPECIKEAYGRTAPEDYLVNGIKVQAKYLNGLVKTLTHNNGVMGHMAKYPDFLAEGGIYHIPQDQYNAMQKLISLSDEEINKASHQVRTIVQRLRDFQEQAGIDLNSDSIQPAIGTYDEVQLGKINDTIDKEDKAIRDKDKERRDDAYQASKPTLREGVKVTAASAAIEGGVSFGLAVAAKRKSGKKILEFTSDDWKDIGIDTAVGGGKGAVRGAGIYTLTNFTATPAAVASALVTATFGLAAQASLLQQGKISNEDFIINSEVICLDVTVSTIASLMGQVAIPIPVLGAVIGNTAGMFMYGIAKNHLTEQEQALIARFNSSIQLLNEQLDEHYCELLERLNQEFARFQSVLELAFDLDVNLAFEGSIGVAIQVGCDEDKILRGKPAVDAYFRN